MRALASDAKYSKLHELLTIFASRGLAEYNAFHASHGPTFEAELGIDHDVSLRAIRLLTLTSLASSKPSLAYDAIAEAISVRACVRALLARSCANSYVLCLFVRAHDAYFHFHGNSSLATTAGDGCGL